MLSNWPAPVHPSKLGDANRLLQHVKFARVSDWPELRRYALDQLSMLLTPTQFAHAMMVIDRSVRLRFRGFHA